MKINLGKILWFHHSPVGGSADAALGGGATAMGRGCIFTLLFTTPLVVFTLCAVNTLLGTSVTGFTTVLPLSLGANTPLWGSVTMILSFESLGSVKASLVHFEGGGPRMSLASLGGVSIDDSSLMSVSSIGKSMSG